MKIKKQFLSMIILMSFVLTACSGIPNMSDEQEEMVSEYAASLLLKYDAENHSRLIDVTDYITEYTAAEQRYKAQEEKYYTDKQREEDERREETLNQETLSSSYSESTAGSAATTVIDRNGGATVVDARSVEDFLGLSGFSINYNGNDLVHAYPEEASIDSVIASEDKNLLVIYFTVTNNNSSDSAFNMPGTGMNFSFSVNGGKYYSANPTLLDNDLYTYSGTFAAGESKSFVIVSELPKGINIESLNMKVASDTDALIKSLK